MAVTDTSTQRRQNVRRPAEPTGDASVDNAIHSIKADLMDTEDRLIEHMDERFDKVGERLDAVDGDLRAIKGHLGIDDG